MSYGKKISHYNTIPIIIKMVYGNFNAIQMPNLYQMTYEKYSIENITYILKRY
jgi:hypothetical protein